MPGVCVFAASHFSAETPIDFATSQARNSPRTIKIVGCEPPFFDQTTFHSLLAGAIILAWLERRLVRFPERAGALSVLPEPACLGHKALLCRKASDGAEAGRTEAPCSRVPRDLWRFGGWLSTRRRFPPGPSCESSSRGSGCPVPDAEWLLDLVHLHRPATRRRRAFATF